MPTVNAGSSVTLTLSATDAYTVSTAGEAYVDLLAGAPGSPSESPRIVNGSLRFGPYGVAAQIRVRAVSGAADYATYAVKGPVLATAAEAAAFQSMVSGAGNQKRKRGLLLVGDSLMADIDSSPTHCNNAGIYDALVNSNAGLGGALCTTCVVFIGAERNCPAGAGTLTYTKASNSITWAPNGGTAGAAVVLDRTKTVKLDGGAAGQGVWVTLRPSIGATNKLPAVDTTDTTVNVGATGAGYLPVIQAQAQSFTSWLMGDLYDDYRLAGTFATSGNWTQNIVDQMPEILATPGVDEVLILLGTNDAAGNAVSTATANLTTVAAALNSAGKFVRFVGLPPRGASTDTTAIVGYKDALNSWLVQYVQGKPSMAYHDVGYTLRSTTPTYAVTSPFDVDTTMFKTGAGEPLHPSRKGSIAFSAALSAQMRRTTGLRYESPYDLYSATTNAWGNHVTNPQMLVGSSRVGTVIGAKIESGSGTITGSAPMTNANPAPDDWSVWSVNTGAGASSIVTRASVDATDLTPGNYWAFTHSLAGEIRRYIGLTLANFVAGDYIQFVWDIAVNNPSLFTRLDFRVDFGGADRLSFGQNAGDTPGAGTALVRRTITSPIMKIPASWAWTGQGGNPSTVRLYCYANSASGVMYLGQAAVRKVPAPI